MGKFLPDKQVGGEVILPANSVEPAIAPRIVGASMDDVGMGDGAGTAAAMEGIHASTARLDALFLEDHRLEAGTAATGAGAGPNASAGADGSAAALMWMCFSAGTRSASSGWR
jgi:hypothetical protein